MSIRYYCLPLCLFLCSIGLQATNPTLDPSMPANPMLETLSNQDSREEFSGFMVNVLRQVGKEEFDIVVDETLANKNPTNDTQLYHELFTNVSKILPMVPSIKKLQALWHQKKVLTAQAQQLIGPKKRIDGCIEIGSPTTYSSALGEHYTFEKTKCYALTEKKRFFSDYVQSYAPNRYGIRPGYQHLVLNYDPVDSKRIPEKSVELVTCFIGLHHVPKEKLDEFVASIARSLKPGGVLLLRDHDAKDERTTALVHTAHSVFNLILARQGIVEEKREYRNFQPLSHWIELLEKHGFEVSSERLVQDGDPSLNTMIKCTKKPTSKEEELELIAQQLKDNDPEYQRDMTQTYLTIPEWNNVDFSQEYGAFINHTPFYEFPYMESTASYWKRFGKAFRAAQKKQGFFPTLTSAHTCMNLFIGITMTAQCLASAAISWPIRKAIGGQAPTTISMLVADPRDELAPFEQIEPKIPSAQHQELKLIHPPRYKQFLELITKLAETKELSIVEIAGQKEIVIKVSCTTKQAHKLEQLEQCFLHDAWSPPTRRDITYAQLVVPVEKLLFVVKELQKQNVELIYVHDF